MIIVTQQLITIFLTFDIWLQKIEIILKGIVFHTIFFGVNKGNEFLIKLSDDTQGYWTFANSLEGLNNFFERISQDNSGTNEDKNFQV